MVRTHGSVLPGMLGKVAVFITRQSERGPELLLLDHPYAGLQLPAGTMEKGESAANAALREAREETGLDGLTVARFLGHEDEPPVHPAGYYVLHTTPVYARPDPTSFDWATFRRGVAVRHERTAGDYVQVTYEEWDDLCAPSYVTYRITGWTPAANLAASQRRFFYRLCLTSPAPDAPWTADSDNHTFTLRWTPLADPAPLIPFQQAWLDRNLDRIMDDLQ